MNHASSESVLNKLPPTIEGGRISDFLNAGPLITIIQACNGSSDLPLFYITGSIRID